MQRQIQHFLISARYHLESQRNKNNVAAPVDPTAPVDSTNYSMIGSIKREYIENQPLSDTPFNHTPRTPSMIMPSVSQSTPENNPYRHHMNTEETMTYLPNTANRSEMPNTNLPEQPHSSSNSAVRSISNSAEIPDVFYPAVANNFRRPKTELRDISSAPAEQHFELPNNVIPNNDNFQSFPNVDQMEGVESNTADDEIVNEEYTNGEDRTAFMMMSEEEKIESAVRRLLCRKTRNNPQIPKSARGVFSDLNKPQLKFEMNQSLTVEEMNAAIEQAHGIRVKFLARFVSDKWKKLPKKTKDSYHDIMILLYQQRRTNS
ncbi:hypothetical protein Ddc_17088 [Ditylenchus destructor]|nr:hypothetical protein Ddc_17088 [Ditylenchus destructor]